MQGGVGLGTFHIHSGTLVCMDAAGTIAHGDLVVKDGTIEALGDRAADALATLPDRRADESFDASGCFVLPGFVHGHLHLCQTLFRGLAEQSDLLRWLRDSIWPLEAAHTAASVRASARLGLCEMLRGGVTCINDMGTVHHTEAIAEVLEETGVRAVFGKALMDRGVSAPRALIETPKAALDSALALADRFHGAAGGRLSVSLAPRFILSCSEGLWRNAADAARERELVLHTHLAESPSEAREVEAAVGSSAARFFARREVLGPRFVGAHGVWLDAEEIAALKRADAALVHCPGSNLKLGSGIARVRQWMTAGLRCGIGSDGAACDNRLDTFHEMSLAGSLSRAVDPADPLSAREVVTLATRGGAEALGLGAITGSLEAGKAADVVVIDANGPHLAPHPADDPYAAIVHAARDSDVRLTMVAGRALYREGRWITLDPERVIAEARAEARGLVARCEPAR
jgi:5-methylthioadenosine/S-adenosylhomocysteine deaminase